MTNISLLHVPLHSVAPRMLLRLPWLLAEVRRHRPSQLVEIGPGLGDLAAMIRTATGARVDLFEASSEGRQLLRARFESDAGVRIREEGFPPGSETGEKYDCAIACEVLEHVEDDAALLASVRRVLKPGGRFIGSVPAFTRKWQQVDDYAGHVRRYEVSDLRQKLVTAGFDVERIEVYGFPLTNMMYPFRQAYYLLRNRQERLSPESATLRSGIDRPRPWRLVRIGILLLARLAAPLQRMTATREWGDGLVFVARRI